MFAWLWVAGCSGRAEITAIPFTRKDLAGNEPLVSKLPPADQCAWFLDAEGNVRVAMHYENIPLFGKFSKAEWNMALQAEGLPASRERSFTLYRDHFRGLYSISLDHRRFQSRWGVLVLTRLSGDRLRGRFQIAAAQQQFTLFEGWAPPGYQAPLWILWGEFEAVHDPKRAEAILAVLNAEDWGEMLPGPALQPRRLEPRAVLSQPTTQPATRSASPNGE
ncbi:MAG: hypothetical protein JXA69_11870 [Phycisphaerae bacterium]|nr:hypothetical protein [Phycisphaerae bacterium]